MKRYLLLTTMLLTMLMCYAQQVITVKKNDAQSLLEAVAQANKLNADKQAKRMYILIPDGVYDLGEKVLTRITGHHIAFVGQSMEGTVIMNKPDIKQEGISKTAIFQNRGTDNYFQDLTLKNALDYYAAKSAGRAVTLQDKGTRTICNRVRMLSYQDTYYSDGEDCQLYFQDSEIHGTVDFICGGGDVWFERCRIVTEKRTSDGKGRNVIAAPRTSDTPWGYIFNHCTVENIVSNFEYARGWNRTPHCIWLYTTLLSPEKLNANRFDTNGMNTVLNDFKEYGTVDASGRSVTPATNVLTFTMQKKKQEGDKEITRESSYTSETIMTDAEAARYTIGNVFGDWHPDCQLKKIEKKARKLMKRLQ
jgi:pectin methylesterase-like acyl-CoA thioesterase